MYSSVYIYTYTCMHTGHSWSICPTSEPHSATVMPAHHFRYTLGGQLIPEDGSPAVDTRTADGASMGSDRDRGGVPWASWLPPLGPGLTRSTRNFILPAGFPHSVTPDYLDYM